MKAKKKPKASAGTGEKPAVEPSKYRYDSPTRFIGHDDPRYDEYAKFKEEHGFSPDETWSLDTVMEEFLLPRIRHYREVSISYPAMLGSMEKWHAVLDEIIWMMEQDVWNANNDDRRFLGPKKKWPTPKEVKSYNRRMGRARKLFGKYWMALWW